MNKWAYFGAGILFTVGVFFIWLLLSPACECVK
jgi:hypothetical protein